jgi:aldehyde:ferredoxin oxidoreductase
MYGWAGRILRVNLSSGKITAEPLNEQMAQTYVGGRGFCVRALYDELKPGIDPLSPENKVIFGVGPACGTLVPGGQRWTVIAKSPLSGFIGDANCGSAFGAGLKYAGYDMAIIEGKSDKPCYLLITDDKVEIRDAKHLWGKMTDETERLLKKELGDPDIETACIGPAGERLVLFSSLMSENRAAGRTGIGAVLGSKLVKAVVAKGKKGVKVAYPGRLEKLSREIYQNWHKKNPAGLNAMRQYGAGVNKSDAFNALGMIGTRNYRDGVFEGYDTVKSKRIKEYFVKSKGCFSCPVCCNHLFVIPAGPFAGTFGSSLHAPSQQYTARIGNSDVEFMFKLAALSDQYGIDQMNMASIIGYVIECFEAGILRPADLYGLKMEWGETRAIMKLFEMVVQRKGIGDLLAEGATRAARVIGQGSEKYVMEVKGMSIDAKDPRGCRSYALGYAVAARGAEHCRAITPCWLEEGQHFPEEKWLKNEIKGFIGFDRLSQKGKGEMYKYYEDVRGGFEHCLESCIFVVFSPEIAWTEILAGIYNAVTGLDMAYREVVTVGERLANIDRAFNIREGLTRKDDTLPDRFLSEKMPDGPTKDQIVNLDQMIDDYYECRGWDKKTGFPTRSKLEELRLKDIANDLEQMGRLGREKARGEI